MDIPLRYITAGDKEESDDNCKTLIYGLSDDGRMYAYDPDKDHWKPKSNPRTGAGKDKPDPPNDHIPSWKEL